MRKFILLLIVIFYFSTIISAQTDTKIKIATYVTGEIESAYKNLIYNKLVSHITSSNKYIAVERSSEFQDIIGKEHNFQRSGIVDDKQIIELGNQFGVRYVIGVNASKLFNEIYLVAKQLDILTGEILNTIEVSATVKDRESLQQLSIDVCEYLLYNYNNIVVSRGIDKPQDLTDAYTSDFCPKGYHMATTEELKFLIKAHKASGRKLYTPIITNIKWGGYYKFDSGYNQCKINFKIIRENLSIEDGTETALRHRKDNYFYTNKTQERYYIYYIKD